MNDELKCPDCKGYHDAPLLIPLFNPSGEQDGSDWCEHDIHEPSRLARLAEEE